MTQLSNDRTTDPAVLVDQLDARRALAKSELAPVKLDGDQWTAVVAKALEDEKDALHALRAVLKLTSPMDDGLEYEHRYPDHCEWEPVDDCPACWAQGIRNMIVAVLS